jgi:hypothetical protein
MNQSDFDLLSAALARVHHDAMTRQRQGVVQAERTALAIADAIAREHRTFDPVRFMLAACEAAETGQLTAPVRRELAERLGTRRPRPRLRSEHPGLHPDEMIDTSRWTETSRIGGPIRDVSSSHAANMAIGSLTYAGVETLGQLMAKNNEDLRAIPRVGPAAMEAIRKVKELWRAKQQAAPGSVSGRPPDSLQPGQSAPATRTAQLGFTKANPLAVPARPPRRRPNPPDATSRLGASPSA